MVDAHANLARASRRMIEWLGHLVENSGGSKNADQNLSEERLKILANVAIEQVPFPEQGMLTEEDAWTISPGPTRARLNSQQSVPNVAATLAPAAAPAPVAHATVDTSGLERLISSRLDMVEDVLRMVEHRLDEGVTVSETSSSEDGAAEYGTDEDDDEGLRRSHHHRKR